MNKRHIQLTGLLCPLPDKVPGSAARRAGPSPAGTGRGAEEGGGQAARRCPGEDELRFHCHHPREAVCRAQKD